MKCQFYFAINVLMIALQHYPQCSHAARDITRNITTVIMVHKAIQNITMPYSATFRNHDISVILMDTEEGVGLVVIKAIVPVGPIPAATTGLDMAPAIFYPQSERHCSFARVYVDVKVN